MGDEFINFRKLHEGFMKELGRVPEGQQGFDASSAPVPPKGPVATGPSEEMSLYLARIEQAAALLQEKIGHARQLEEVVYSLQDRQAELEAGLEEATRRNAELEQSFATERDRATRAQAILAQTAKRMQEMERARADAKARADALASAIDRAFGEVIGPSQDHAIAAA